MTTPEPQPDPIDWDTEPDEPSPFDADEPAAAWPDAAALIKQLATLTEDDRVGRIFALGNWLAGKNELERMRYRSAIVEAGYMGAGDWRTMMAEAKKEREKAHVAAKSSDAPDGSPYVVRGGHLHLRVDEPYPHDVLLAKFVPKVIAEVTRDDDTEVTKNVRIQVTRPGGRSAEVEVPAEHLPQARKWATQAIGAAAVITPMSRDEAHVATAAQYIGDYQWTTETVYTHTGWRSDLADGKHHYLTASGALGADGLDTGITVDLGEARLNYYALPDPSAVEPAELAEAVRASLDLRHVAPLKVTAPAIAAAYRAPLPVPATTGVFLVGASGTRKTAFAAVVCQHYGRHITAKTLPAGWNSTGNALEALAHQMKNVLLCIDDYAPQAADDPRKLAATADAIIRGSANGSGRGRLRRDGTRRPAKQSRAQVMATGEDVPPGESLRGRLTVAAVEPQSIDLKRLTVAQQHGDDGLYELATAGYVRWLAKQWDTHPDYAGHILDQINNRRSEIAVGGHSRVPEAAADLLTAWRQWLGYAVAVEAVTAAEAKKIMAEVTEAILETAKEQVTYTGAMKVPEVYLTSLASALAGGHAHIADQDTGREPPSFPTQWGWEPYTSGDIQQFHPRGTRIGWVSRDGGAIYLDPGPAFEVARAHATKSALPLNTTKHTVHKQLAEGAYLASTDKDQVGVIRRVHPKRKRVLHINASRLTGDLEGEDQ